ncbi:MAG: gamma-glutamylcyclotransferase family protein [Pseudomonadota bacterium]
MSLPTHLFVYGTLLTTAEHAMGKLLRAHATLHGQGSIQACLYLIDDPDAPGQNSYPGALPAPRPDQRVYGEVYALQDAATLIEAFDDYEACAPHWPEPHEFMCRKVPVTMADGSVLKAVAYLYTWDVSSAEPIPSGRFTDKAAHVR